MTKLNIIRAVDLGEKKADVAKKFNIMSSTLSTILKNRLEIEKSDVPGYRKRTRMFATHTLEKNLFDWLSIMKTTQETISGRHLQQKALEVAQRIGLENFQASNGWLYKFKNRWNITDIKITK